VLLVFMAPPEEEGDTHVPKIDPVTKYRVVTYGDIYRADSPDEQKLYCFRHQRGDFKITEGIIPVNFVSQFWLDEGHPIFLSTRCGGFDQEFDEPVGPEYLIQWKKEKEPVPPATMTADGSVAATGWKKNLDELWVSVLMYFERKNLLSEESLDYLDADPFVLFGIDAIVTQQALKKLQSTPALLCEGILPSLDEWSLYLRIPPGEKEVEWLVKAFSETELPVPWTCYKGMGSIVCFIRADSGQVTWKHPFFDYFRQLKEFCRQGTVEEIMQVRVNRMLWSYEATRIETEHYQEPLVAPEFVEILATIFGYDVRIEGCIVRNVKGLLKLFAVSFRDDQNVKLEDIILCAETLERDVEKHEEMKKEWRDATPDGVAFELKALSNGAINCVNCETTALAFCLECKDYLCLGCYDKLHTRGARREHAPFRLVSCSMCVTQPAKLHCTFTDKSLCHECYAMKHIRMLPPDGKENQPRQIDYVKQYVRYATFASDRRKAKQGQIKLTPNGEVDDSYESVLSSDWHPFYDSRGVKFYHNFLTGERMRQSPQQVPNTADAEAPENRSLAAMNDEDVKPHSKVMQAEPLALTGFDSLATGPRAAWGGANEPDKRNLRAPHRIHMPCEVPQL